MLKELDNKLYKHVAYIDLCVLSTSIRAIDQDAIRNNLAIDDEAVRDWVSRFKSVLQMRDLEVNLNSSSNAHECNQKRDLIDRRKSIVE